MKKASLTLLLIASAFICIMTGTLIGRHTTINHFYGEIRPAAVVTDENIDPSALGKVNINTATLTQLDSLPGIGPVLAQRIIDYRTEHGSFSALEDLLMVAGIGQTRFDEIKDYITTGG